MLAAAAARVHDGLARPVSRVLVQSGEAVENRALADVRVPWPARSRSRPRRGAVQSPPTRRVRWSFRSSPCLSSSAVRRMMLRQSPRAASASTAPRTRNARGSPPGLTPTHPRCVRLGSAPYPAGGGAYRSLLQPHKLRRLACAQPRKAEFSVTVQKNTRLHHQYIARRQSGFIPLDFWGEV